MVESGTVAAGLYAQSSSTMHPTVRVGEADGAAVGEADGAAVGAAVGEADGAAVGAVVGPAVGEAVGAMLRRLIDGL